MKSSTRILHLITGLNTGGAEVVLLRLLACIDRKRFEIRVVSIIPIGPIGEKIQALGIPVISLEMLPGKPTLSGLSRFIQLLREFQPNILQTWMYHADLIGGVSAHLVGNIPIIWGIHNSTIDPALTKKSTILVAKLCAIISPWVPDKIVSCSQRARNVHIGVGYRADKFIFIPNGFDTQYFKPIPAAHSVLCNLLGISPDKKIVGLIARFHPQKDVENFIKAVTILFNNYPETHFVLCGSGMTPENEELARWIKSAEIQSRIHLLGLQNDILDIVAGLDVCTLSSAFGEAFPLAIGEAMSCGIPCVCTDVGDSAYLIGDTGLVVPPHDSKALAKAIGEILSLPEKQRKTLGEKARQRIQENFSLKQMVHAYTNLYDQLANIEDKTQP